MQITRIGDKLMESKTAKRYEVAKKTIVDCVAQGDGTYEIVDDEKVFLHNGDLIEKLKVQAFWYNHKHHRDHGDEIVKAITKNNKEKVLVIVKDSGSKC